VARESYGRLIAYLSARSRDVAAAEDALGDALHAALIRWPTEGVPDKPEAWLMAAAKRRLIDAVRRQDVRMRAEPALQILVENQITNDEPGTFPDERLKLLFVCAHPAIDVATRTPLMLQTVLGLEADQIASAFLVAPSAMAQRLVRAKQKIRDAGIPFAVPEPHEWNERVSFVLDALYSAYTTGWDSCHDASSRNRGLTTETLALARILTQLMPDEPEARGLLALMLHLEARTAARFNAQGEFVPLDRQEASLWTRPLMQEAESHLRAAALVGRPGRFQLEAAIQSVHAGRIAGVEVDWVQIALLYEGLLERAPSIGAKIGFAVALAKAKQAHVAWNVLNEVTEERAKDYQPYWVARAYLLKLLGKVNESDAALVRAIGLTENPALRTFLMNERSTSTTSGAE
jgi:RNA polymerase sigma-70 factor (ECF subfamily)